MNNSTQSGPASSSRLIPGLVVAGIGILFLLNNLNIVYFHEIWKFWPLILIAIGASKLIDSPDSENKAGGGVLLVVGGIFLAANLGVLTWRVWNFWPLLLIGAGLMMLFNRIHPSALGIRTKGSRPGTRADAIAIFGGFKRRATTDDYRGANYIAIFGGGEIDLRGAQMMVESAVVEITAVFGGFELRVPPNWIVVNEMVGIFGGTADETRQPQQDGPAARRLIVRGAAVFGGVGIKN